MKFPEVSQLQDYSSRDIQIWKGICVQFAYKEQVLALMDALAPSCAEIGALSIAINNSKG